MTKLEDSVTQQLLQKTEKGVKEEKGKRKREGFPLFKVVCTAAGHGCVVSQSKSPLLSVRVFTWAVVVWGSGLGGRG